MKTVTKAERVALERLFVADWPVKLGGSLGGLVQSRSAVYEKLVAAGLAESAELRINGVFEVVIRGYRITAFGHMTYCVTCDPPATKPRRVARQGHPLQARGRARRARRGRAR